MARAHSEQAAPPVPAWGRQGDRPLAARGPSSKSHALGANEQTRHLAQGLGYRPAVPPPRNRNQSWSYDRALYRRRNESERFFCRLKRFRRIATRYDKLNLSFLRLGLIRYAIQLLRTDPGCGPLCAPSNRSAGPARRLAGGRWFRERSSRPQTRPNWTESRTFELRFVLEL